MILSHRHARTAAVVSIAVLWLMLGGILLAKAQTLEGVHEPQRVLGTSNTLANHDLVNPGPENATHVRYTFWPMPPLTPAQLKITDFWMEPHMSNPNTVPVRQDGSTTTQLTWGPTDMPILARTMTHIGYNVGANVTDCLQSVLGGTVQFLSGQDPIAEVGTTNIDWCGPTTEPFHSDQTGILMDGRGDPMSAWVNMVGGTPVTITARVGATDQDTPPDQLLPLLMDSTFDRTFDLFTQSLDPVVLDVGGRIELYTFPATVTNGVEWLGIAMDVQLGGASPATHRSYFARKVDDPDEHPPVTDTPTPRPLPTTPTATPTATQPAPTDTPAPTVTEVPITPQACPNIESRVPAAELQAALANPASVNGYGQRCFPSQPVSPFNPLRQTLDLQNPNRPYHPLFNPLIFTCGC